MRVSVPMTLALVVACAAAPPATEPAAPTAPLALPEAGDEDVSDAATTDALAPIAVSEDASSDATVSSDAAPAALAADGSACSVSTECASGLCEGQGCGEDGGECVSTTRSCSPKLGWYCGCDGKDFQASDSCPGRRYAYKARCTSARAWGRGTAPDFASCVKASQCASGVCEGRGCDDEHPGTCQPAGRGCGQSAVQYCGCDGRSFSSSPCPGVRFASTGWCALDPSARSAIKVLSVTGNNASTNDELKRTLLASERLRRCHLSSGEKTFTATLDFEVDGKGRVRVNGVDGLGHRGSLLPGCIQGFARATVLTPGAGAARVSVKLRFELTHAKP